MLLKTSQNFVIVKTIYCKNMAANVKLLVKIEILHTALYYKIITFQKQAVETE